MFLPEIPLPAIAHVIVKEQLHHFVGYLIKFPKKNLCDGSCFWKKIEEYTIEEFFQNLDRCSYLTRT